VSGSEPAAPVFLVGAPPAAADPLLLALARGSGVLHVREDFLAAVPAAGDEGAREAAAREALVAALVDREGQPAERGVPVVGGASVARSVALLAAAWPDARFVFVAERPGDALPARLAALPPERRVHTDLETLVADPRGELRRLCAILGVPYDQALLAPLEDVRRAREAAGESPLRSVFTASVPDRLTRLGGSLLVSTYQTGKLICARADSAGGLNTHFRDFDKPMGIAVADGRFCLGTRTEVWDLRDMPEVAPRLEPSGTHDACYLPRNRHVTGDMGVHEMAFAGGELWLVATAFSCLATLDAHYSFVPRWTPPFVTGLAPDDRCHLNGLAVVDDEVRYVTALGASDEPGGWRPGKASGGVVVDVPSSEVVATGLSMPHSPRWHDGRLWVLESGRGGLGVLDLGSGRMETVAELPGFTRGLAFTGGTALVGLSQIRESSTFGDLPLVERLEERLCGVWMVDTASGAVEGFLRFDDLVQEVFEVALLPGTRWPEVAEPGSTAVSSSYVLP
jgi:uncharacterized protein (TIGR03032 family)